MAILEDKKKRQEIRSILYKDLASGGVPIPETVKKLRKILSMDQNRFSKEVGISLSTLRRIEQGQDNYKLSTLQKILEKFDLNLVIVKLN